MYASVGVMSKFGAVLFGPNHLNVTVLGCQVIDPIPPEVRRKESLKL